MDLLPVELQSGKLVAESLAILIAVSANALVKWLMALRNGTRELAFWLGGGSVVMFATCTGLFYWMASNWHC